MASLFDYVRTHTERGACRCGQCIDAVATSKPAGHSVRAGFFDVALRGTPSVEGFTEQVKAHKGVFSDVDVFDGDEHNYMELGAWLGDQGTAIQFMALGSLLGVFTLLTPAILGVKPEDPMYIQMAQAGLLSIVVSASQSPEVSK